MSFPQNQLWKVINDGEVEPIGSFTVTSSGELTHIVIPSLLTGSYTSDTMTMSLYYDSSLAGLFCASSPVRVADLYETAPSRLRCRFDFANQRLQAGVQYYAAITTANYVRNGDTKYLAVGANVPTVMSGTGNNLGASFEVYHKRVTSY